jgi:hypothetical protein
MEAWGEVLGGEVRVPAPSTIVRFSFGDFAAGSSSGGGPLIRRHRANSWKLALAWSREENRRKKKEVRAEQNRTEQNRTEQSRAEQSRGRRAIFYIAF